MSKIDRIYEPCEDSRGRIDFYFGKNKLSKSEGLLKRVLQKNYIQTKDLYDYFAGTVPAEVSVWFKESRSFSFFFNETYFRRQESIDHNGFNAAVEGICNIGYAEKLHLLPLNYFNFLRDYKHIDLSLNDIYFLPGELYDQEQIEVLILKCNNLRYIDPKIGQLINLETLDLRGNVKLASLPESLINCHKLIDIRLSNDMKLIDLPMALESKVTFY